MALPSLHALLETNLPIVVCARPWARSLLSAYPIAGFVPMTGKWQTDRKSVAAFRRQHQHQKAVGLLLPDSLSSALVFRLAGLPCAGYRDDGRSLLLRWPISKPVPKPHAVASWYFLTQTALKQWNLRTGSQEPPASLGLQLKASARNEAQASLQQAGLSKDTDFVLIAPTATGLHKGKVKVWPHFDALAQGLQKQGLTVVMCPPANEREEAKRNAPTALCLAPLTLDAFVALAQMAKVVVCNDSGVSHLAAAGNARQITLFGVTEQTHTGPWSAQAHCLGKMGQWPELDKVMQKTILLAGS